MGQIHIIAFGANMPSEFGPPQATIAAALSALSGAGVSLGDVSPYYRTPCFPAGAGPDYVNCAALVSHPGSPRDVLDILHRVEATLGRVRTKRWGTRIIDIDLIASGDAVLPDALVWKHWHDLPVHEQLATAPDQLILPHPRLQDRAFVLVPLCDIAPNWVHPVLKCSAKELLSGLDKRAVSQVVRV